MDGKDVEEGNRNWDETGEGEEGHFLKRDGQFVPPLGAIREESHGRVEW